MRHYPEIILLHYIWNISILQCLPTLVENTRKYGKLNIRSSLRVRSRTSVHADHDPVLSAGEERDRSEAPGTTLPEWCCLKQLVLQQPAKMY